MQILSVKGGKMLASSEKGGIELQPLQRSGKMQCFEP